MKLSSLTIRVAVFFFSDIADIKLFTQCGDFYTVLKCYADNFFEEPSL